MKLNPDGIFESDLLSRFSWLSHGFGTRLSGNWPGSYTTVKQTHSNIVQRADVPGSVLGEGDALITAIPNVRVGIRTADCVPMLIVDPDHRAVAAVHAGWRGTVKQIVTHTVDRMAQDFGTDPRTLHIAIGPCIGECCFQVGSEVAEQFRPFFENAEQLSRIDLVKANLLQLSALDVQDKNIDVAGLCTMCDPVRLHSFRRDKEASGRMVAVVEIRPE